MVSSTPPMDDEWLASKCTESDILSLVDECLLQPQATIKLCAALGHSRPFKEMNEIVLFSSFVERSFGIPTSDFIHGLLFH